MTERREVRRSAATYKSRARTSRCPFREGVRRAAPRPRPACRALRPRPARALAQPRALALSTPPRALVRPRALALPAPRSRTDRACRVRRAPRSRTSASARPCRRSPAPASRSRATACPSRRPWSPSTACSWAWYAQRDEGKGRPDQHWGWREGREGTASGQGGRARA